MAAIACVSVVSLVVCVVDGARVAMCVARVCMCARVCVWLCVATCVCVCARVWLCVWLRVCVAVCVCVCLCVWLCVCVAVFVWLCVVQATFTVRCVLMADPTSHPDRSPGCCPIQPITAWQLLASQSSWRHVRPRPRHHWDWPIASGSHLGLLALGSAASTMVRALQTSGAGRLPVSACDMRMHSEPASLCIFVFVQCCSANRNEKGKENATCRGTIRA